MKKTIIISLAATVAMFGFAKGSFGVDLNLNNFIKRNGIKDTVKDVVKDVVREGVREGVRRSRRSTESRRSRRSHSLKDIKVGHGPIMCTTSGNSGIPIVGRGSKEKSARKATWQNCVKHNKGCLRVDHYTCTNVGYGGLDITFVVEREKRNNNTKLFWIEPANQSIGSNKYCFIEQKRRTFVAIAPTYREAKSVVLQACYNGSKNSNARRCKVRNLTECDVYYNGLEDDLLDNLDSIKEENPGWRNPQDRR